MTGNSVGAETTAAAAYQHAADMAAALRTKAKEAGPYEWIRVEYIEHLADELAALAKETR